MPPVDNTAVGTGLDARGRYDGSAAVSEHADAGQVVHRRDFFVTGMVITRENGFLFR